MTRIRTDRTRGFTLVEMLVTITVIGIIVAMSMGALMNAQETAREQRTRSLIGKLHTQMMYRWESYQTRRIPMLPRGPGENMQQFAARRLQAQRELMRLELPERWSDVTAPATGGDPVSIAYLTETPALSESYLRRYLQNKVGGQLSEPSTENQSAECLYLIVTMGHDDSMGGLRFRAADVGDTDNDGMPEFIDGWGRPIRFLRWAPGFLPGPPYSWQTTPENLPPGVNNATDVATTDLQTGNWNDDHDPFDPLKVDAPGSPILPASIQNDAWRGYRLMPLIYSAGPDGKTDIVAARGTATFDYSATTPLRIDPYSKDDVRMMGTPFDEDVDGFDHMDNITNHALGVR